MLSSGLVFSTSCIVDQILPGYAVVCCPDDHPRYPSLPVVIFQGNVGDDQSATIYGRLAGHEVEIGSV